MTRRVDAGDPEHVQGAVKRAGLQQQREAEELRQILESPAGRAFLWRLLSQCGIYQSSFDGTVEGTFFREGKRNIGLWAVEQIFTAAPDAYTLMRSEAVSRETKAG